MTRLEYRKSVMDASKEKNAANAQELIELLDKLEELIFAGEDDPQPLKWHQLKRIYALAQNCIKLIIMLLPYIKIIIKWLK